MIPGRLPIIGDEGPVGVETEIYLSEILSDGSGFFLDTNNWNGIGCERSGLETNHAFRFHLGAESIYYDCSVEDAYAILFVMNRQNAEAYLKQQGASRREFMDSIEMDPEVLIDRRLVIPFLAILLWVVFK